MLFSNEHEKKLTAYAIVDNVNTRALVRIIPYLITCVVSNENKKRIHKVIRKVTILKAKAISSSIRLLEYTCKAYYTLN